MKKNPPSLYEKNHINKNDERLDLFAQLKNLYTINKVLYPGSYAHITPSFIFPHVVYNDMYKNLKDFYDSDDLFNYINKRKIYSTEPYYKYINKDYRKGLPLKMEAFDLLISQYAGFVSRECKSYLKHGGILIVNNSHGDATMASILPDYEFIAVANKRGIKFPISTQNLDEYFIPKKNIEITQEFLEQRNRGVGYKKTATDYIFKKIS